MRELGTWRDAALRQRAKSVFSLAEGDGAATEHTPPPSTPSSTEYEQTYDRQHHARSKSEPPEKPSGKRTSSWAQWWNRGRRGKPSTSSDGGVDGDSTTTSQDKADRSALLGAASAPLHEVRVFPNVRGVWTDTHILDHCCTGC